MHELGLVVIEHPLSTLTDGQIEQRADQAVSQCIEVWLGQNIPGSRLVVR
jgi:hypothetical protein